MMSHFMKRMILRRFLAFFSLMLVTFAFAPFFVEAQPYIPNNPSTDVVEFTGDFDWDTTLDTKTSSTDYITYANFRNNYCLAGTSASACETAAAGKYIRFDSAESLYRFSVDVSYAQIYLTGNPTEDVKLSSDKIAVLLSLNYVLGNNIDYSVMGAKTFIPIGYWFTDTQANEHKNIFTGSFNGQGFVISNLYVAGYNYLIYTDTSNPLNPVDIALSDYYSMFPFNDGSITNFGLLNPTFELLTLHIDIDKVSNVVGINLENGVIDHVYVIDNRTSVLDAGIRYKVGSSSVDFQAAGLVHTNDGTFTDSYYVSKVVVNGSYINKFSIQPVLYINNGTIDNLVYDSDVYLLSVIVGTSTFTIDTPNGLATGEATTLLKSDSSSLADDAGSLLWNFYPSDGYPILFGLVYDSGNSRYLISSARDLVFFSRLIGFVTVYNSKVFSDSDYALTTDIDLSILASNAYSTPLVTFTGLFTGYNSSATDLSENYYIYNMTLTQGIIRGTGFYSGLFSIVGATGVVNNLNISQSSINLTNTEGYYSDIFYVGAVAGRLSAGTFEDIIVDVSINLGTNAIGKTFVGGLVGEASGVINRVSNFGSVVAGDHAYQSSYNVNPKFYIGGIVGGADLLQLHLEEAKNYGDLYGFGTTSTFSFVTGVTSIESKLGGIIGYILNTSTIKHQIVNVANLGDIYLSPTISTISMPSSKNVGGVFGELAGYAPVLELDGVYLFANLYNEGNVHATYETDTSTIHSAGIGVSNTSEAVEYALLFNHGNFDVAISDLSNYMGPDPSFHELFFSEYVEGSSSYNRVLEIYNPSNYAISLSGYSIERYNGGATSPSSTQNLSGTIAAKDVYVVYASSSANIAIRNVGDLVSTVCSFTGDDAVVLKNNGAVIDSIGQVGYDPGSYWSANGVSTYNMTLVRKPTVQTGRTAYTSAFDPSVEWIGYAVNTFSYLGSHTMNAFPDVPVLDYELILYTSTIFDVSASSDVTLSRVYNYSDFNYDYCYYTQISPLYRSLNNNDTVIRYSANFGDISLMENAGSTETVMYTDVYVTGITTSLNVSLINVVNEGNISFVNVNMRTHSLYIAGLSTYLSPTKVAKNSINQGTISFAKISGSGNIYVSGIVNVNLSGDLNDSGQSETQPIATEGIINTINYGNISSSYGILSQGLYAINGTNNTFAAGIASLNSGSIQDSANLGDITVYNSSASGTVAFDNSSQNTAGLITGFTGGVVLGGVAAITLSGDARIYDTGNNGNIYAKAYTFARAGGILGICLYEESLGGGITEGMGLANSIQDSILSNGVNLGNITALTNIIGVYTSSSYTTSFTVTPPGISFAPATLTSSNDRPEIHASAGGIIGYGLSVMKRMLNHGTISSTDVAGGIVGATFALGGSGTTTVTHITTAINYGGVKAVNTTSLASLDLFEFDNLATYYMADGNTFIFPSGYTVQEPRAKRGFGGIFGRLQRGLSGVMTSVGGEFDFIVNANPQVDLIGRLDQVYNFSSSIQYFVFYDAIYYSAKTNDTTQVIFAGYQYLLGAYILTKTGTGPYTYTANATTLHYVVGTRDTSLGAVTNYSFKSPISYTVGTTVTAFASQVPVPWITENPSDPLITNSATQYMYNAAFPMRTDPDLTEYIYYMGYDLLASRFKTTGSNPRPNGMYVLSTSAGSSYGAVLPANINLEDMRVMDENYSEDISLLMDYDNVSVLYTNSLPQAVSDKYDALRQTIFNEKSDLIPNDETTIVMNEVGQSETVLANGTIDYVNHTINFHISMEAFGVSQTTVSYEIVNASTSIYALIAERPDDYYGGPPSSANLLEYRDLLDQANEVGISQTYPADLSVTLPSHSISSNVTLELGYFTIFSEAFIGDDLFASTQYYTSYQVNITFTPTIDQIPTGSIGITSVAFNGGGNVNVVSQTDIRSLGDVYYNGSLKLNFQDTKGILTYNYDFKNYFVLKYSDGSVIPTAYYTVTSVPVTIDTGPDPDVGSYSITFTFLPGIRMGDYTLEYRYFASSSLKTVVFDKTASSQKSILDFDYYSENGSIGIVGTTITSYVNLGYTVDMDYSTTNFTSYNNTGLALYLSNYTYDIDFMNASSLSISNFAAITSARLVQVTYSAGYKTYQMEYIVRAEDNTTSTYTHNLIERTIDLASVLKNGNEIDINDVFAIREDPLTTFTVDLGLDQELDLYSITSSGTDDYFVISVSATHLDGVTPYAPEEILGITYDTNEYLMLYMNFDTEPGIYTFSFVLYRDGTSNHATLSTNLVITKEAGTIAYLTDIRFSDLANETSYPEIYITDDEGVINTSTGLDPRVYFNGIDYDGADELGYVYYRVDGYVANTPLNEYVPFILNYLPYGSTLSRRAYNTNTTSWYWTSEVDNSSTLEEKSVLLADYTMYPDTGLEPGEGEFVVVQYRVTSEDGMNFAYYYTTVTDVTYNVSLIFDIYYCSDETLESCTLASQSVEMENQVVIISVMNLDTNGDDSVFGVTDPANYPTFSAVNSINNQMTQLNYTYDGNYRYSFGRDISGFYVFKVTLPKDRYWNELYTYDIGFLTYTLNDASTYVSTLDGKYFYIETATVIRTRRFNVYIRDAAPPETNIGWGLFDFFRSWDN